MIAILSQDEFNEVWNNLPPHDRVLVKIPLGGRGVVIPDESTGGVVCFVDQYAGSETPFTFERCLSMAKALTAEQS